jgi:hypothetical protein
VLDYDFRLEKMDKNDIIFGIILPVIAVFVIGLVSKLQLLIGEKPECHFDFF